MSTRVDIYQDRDGQTHFFPYEPGHRKAAPSICGRTRDDMQRGVAWFPVGDPRGRVHFERACDVCGEGLAV